MRKHAYLIMVHNNYKVLEKLLLSLDAEFNDFYIHVDKKVKEFPFEYFNKLLSHSQIFFFKEISVNWGGYSQVQCELFLMKEAVKKEYSYLHLLSCADMPIKSKEYIYSFFESCDRKIFIDFDEVTLKANFSGYQNRIRRYFPIQEYKKCSENKVIQFILAYTAKAVQLFQILFGVDRIRNKKIDIYYGSQWFSIPAEYAQYVLSKEKYIDEVFSCTQYCDELMMQMILMQSEYKEDLYAAEGIEYTNMRLIEWEFIGAPHPKVWTINDIDKLWKSPYLYARKFDENIDLEVVEALYERGKEAAVTNE